MNFSQIPGKKEIIAKLQNKVGKFGLIRDDKIKESSGKAGDIAQDVTFTFTGTAKKQFRPDANGVIEIDFVGLVTAEVTGGPAQPPTTTTKHLVTLDCIVGRP
jgi:hypothetical protein